MQEQLPGSTDRRCVVHISNKWPSSSETISLRGGREGIWRRAAPRCNVCRHAATECKTACACMQVMAVLRDSEGTLYRARGHRAPAANTGSRFGSPSCAGRGDSSSDFNFQPTCVLSFIAQLYRTDAGRLCGCRRCASAAHSPRIYSSGSWSRCCPW